MRTLVDASCLRGAQPTGVPNAVRELLRVNAFGLTGSIELATYGSQPPSEAEREAAPYPWNHVRLPSKAMHALCGSGLFSFERLFGRADRLFFPNLNIVGKPRLPYGLLIHDLSFLLHPPWFSPKTRAWHLAVRPARLIRGADTIFTLSPWTKQDIVALLGVPETRIRTVPLPIAQEKPLVTTQRPIPHPYFLLLGAADRRKNADIVRIAYARFRATHPNHRLVLAGCAIPVDEPGIVSLGYLSDADKATWMAHARALLYPSWYEGFGIPPHEAAMLGVPTIAAGNGALAQTCPPGTVLLPAHVPSAWHQALEGFA